MTKVNKLLKCFDWIWYENVWIRNKCIQLEILNVLAKKKINSQVYENDWLQYLLFCEWIWNIWSMDCINVPYWAISSFPFVDYFSGTLSSGEEWWLGWGMVIIRIWLRILCWILFNFSYVHLDFLVFGSYLDIDPLNFMLV